MKINRNNNMKTNNYLKKIFIFNNKNLIKKKMISFEFKIKFKIKIWVSFFIKNF